MKSKNILCGLSMAVVLQLGMLAGSAQTNKYLFSGSETNITLPPGTYIITAYGAPGAYPSLIFPAEGWGGSGAEMSAEFNFSTSTTLTLLVGGGGESIGGAGYYRFGDVGGGGGGSFVVEGTTPLVIAGGGGGQGNGAHPGGNGNVSTNGGSVYEMPGRYVVGGTDGGGGGGGGLKVGGSTGGGGGGGFLGNGTNGFGYIDYGGGGGGSSFETGGNGGNGGFNFSNSGGNGGYGGGGGGGSLGGGGGGGGYSGGGGGFDGSGGGGGGSIIDSSAIAILTEVSGTYSPYYTFNGTLFIINGEIIIIAVPPPLAITADGANVVLTWPAADTGFTTTGYRVESATNLVPPVAWQTNSTAPVVVNGQNTVTNPISGTQMFFRLKQ